MPQLLLGSERWQFWHRVGNCVARRGDNVMVAAQAILEQLEPPHIVSWVIAGDH